MEWKMEIIIYHSHSLTLIFISFNAILDYKQIVGRRRIIMKLNQKKSLLESEGGNLYHFCYNQNKIIIYYFSYVKCVERYTNYRKCYDLISLF